MFNSRFLLVFTISLALLSVVIISLDNEDSKLTFSYLPAQENVRLEQARQPHAEQLSQHQLSQYQLQESSTPPSFWSMESHIAYNNAELKQQKALHQRLLKKSQNQAEQLKQFIAENNALQEQLRKREQMIQEQNAHLEATRQQYQALQVELSEAQKMQKDEDLLMAQNKEMKFKIDSQPDIIKRPKHNEDSSPDKIQQKKRPITHYLVRFSLVIAMSRTIMSIVPLMGVLLSIMKYGTSIKFIMTFILNLKMKMAKPKHLNNVGNCRVIII